MLQRNLQECIIVITFASLLECSHVFGIRGTSIQYIPTCLLTASMSTSKRAVVDFLHTIRFLSIMKNKVGKSCVFCFCTG